MLLQELKKLSDIANQWMLYAETKNTALMAVSGLLLYNIYKLINFGFHQERALFILAVICVSISFISCILSLMPILRFLPKRHQLKKIKADTSSFNVFSTFALTNATPESLTHVLKEKLNLTDHKITPLEEDYATFIIGTAKLTHRKYILFRVALFSLITGIILMGIVTARVILV